MHYKSISQPTLKTFTIANAQRTCILAITKKKYPQKRKSVIFLNYASEK